MKEKQLETILTICTAGIIIYILHPIRYVLFGAIILAIIGLFIMPLSSIIHKAWMKLSEGMGFMSSKIILSVVFFLILMPLALFRKWGKSDVLLLKNNSISLFKEKRKTYTNGDFENMW